MELQIVDVEGGQAKAAYSEPGWRNRFRRNEVRLHDDEVVYVPLRKADRDAVYYVRLWCRSLDGRSVCILVCDAQRELYRRVYRGTVEEQRVLQGELERRLTRGAQRCEARCEMVRRATTAGWHPDPLDPRKPFRAPWARFVVTSAYELEGVSERGWFSERGLKHGGEDGELQYLLRRDGPLFDVQTAHRTLDLRTELLRLVGARAGGGLTLTEDACARLRHSSALHCDLEVQLRFSELRPVELRAMAPLKVLSFDLECCSASDAFPLASRADDRIITAGLYLRTFGGGQDRCTMLCLGDVRRPEESEGGERGVEGMQASELLCFASEAELLLGFAKAVRESDADLVVGYNSCAFDWKYLRDRVWLLWLEPLRLRVVEGAREALVKLRAPLRRAKEALQAALEKTHRGSWGNLGGASKESWEGVLERLGCSVGPALDPCEQELTAPTAQEASPGDARALVELRKLFRLPLSELKQGLGIPQLKSLADEEFRRALELLGYEIEGDEVSPWPDPLAVSVASCRELSPRERDLCLSFSRRVGELTQPSLEKLASSAVGDNVLCYPRMPGRVNLDLWLYLKRENLSDLDNLKLNTVARHFLGDEKHDLPAKAMFQAFREGPEGRWRVAAYCRQDCKLVVDLLKRMEALPSIWEMSKVTCTTPEDILFRGQQLKVYTQLVLEACEHDYVVEDRREGDEEVSEEKYEGATVVDPVPGYYHEPVFCLDFASLYPSLMRTMNLSPDTLVGAGASVEAEVHEIPIRAGLAHRFVRSSVHEGLLPRILKQLLEERKRVKKEMEAEQDGQRRALLNSKQLALKISANSVYGACGALRGRLSFRECAEATTAAGREAINFTCRNISAREGYSIVYGDTDSAFLRIPVSYHQSPLSCLFELGERLAREVTQAIQERTPNERCYIKLEFEKMLNPLCLYKKKRYTGLCYEDVHKPPKVLTRGLEMVRKDACGLTKRAQQEVVRALLELKDPRAAVAVVLEALRGLLAVPPGGPFDALKQSKSLKASYKDEASQVHWTVKELMRLREPGSEPRVGDRVEFVVVASLAERVVDKAEDVSYAQAQRLPPDWLHYFEAIERPLMRLLEVPLRAVAPEELEALTARCTVLKEQARMQTRRHSLARLGVRWEQGHRCKTGAVQLKLGNFGAPAGGAQAGPGASPMTGMAFLAPTDQDLEKLALKPSARSLGSKRPRRGSAPSSAVDQSQRLTLFSFISQ